MTRKPSQALRLTLILAASLCLYWAIHIAQLNPADTAQIGGSDQHINKPSAFLLDSTFFLYNSKGLPSEIHAEKAYFYSYSDLIRIDQPGFTTSPETGTRYTLKADNGDYHPLEKTLLLSGNVTAMQYNQDQLLWTLETDQLLLNYKEGEISSDKAVLVTQGKNSLRAIGLEASMTDKTLNLMSNVRGKYVFETNK
jgi:LPS export ABC transporter protein LptC